MNITSPNISILDFAVKYDLSEVTPKITVTNQSVGTTLSACTWWLILTTPSGTFIHQSNGTSPDRTGVWAPWIISEPWPQPFGQIEWSGNEYSATLFVKDSTATIFSLTKTTTISRPQGSDSSDTDNFATAAMAAEMRCEAAELYTEDRTVYSYNGLQPASVSTTFTLIAPADPSGVIPDPIVVVNNSAVKFPIAYSGDCYQLVLSAIARYDYTNGTSVIVKYKGQKNLSIHCDIDLCPLIDQYTKMLQKPCGDSASERNKRELISGLMVQAMIGKMQPLCNVNVSDIVEQVKKLGGWDCDCRVGQGINTGARSNAITLDIAATCGDLQVQEATVTGNIVRIRLSDTTYKFILAEDSDLESAFILNSFDDPDTCTRTFQIAVRAEELASGIQDLILGYEVGVSNASDFSAAFSFVESLNLVTNKRVFSFKLDAEELVSNDVLNCLEIKPDGFFVNPAKLLTIIQNNVALKDFFCNICPATPVACPVVTGLTAVMGAYDPSINMYEVTLNWTPAPGALNYTVVFGGVSSTTTSSSKVYNVAPGATYSYSVATNCTGSSAAAVSGSIVVGAAPAGCTAVTGVTASVGSWNGSAYPVTVDWVPGTGGVSFTISTPGGNVTVSSNPYTYLQASSTTFNGTVTKNCASASSTPTGFSATTGAVPTIAPPPQITTFYNYSFGSGSAPQIIGTVDPSVTSILISQGLLNGAYTYVAGVITPGNNTHGNAITPTPMGFGATGFTYANGGTQAFKKIKIALTNLAGSKDFEYFEYYDYAGIVSSPPEYVRKTNPTLPYATPTNIGPGTVRLVFNPNGNTPIDLLNNDEWYIYPVANPGGGALVNGSSTHTFVGLPSGLNVFEMTVTKDNGNTGLAMVPIVVNIP